MKWFSATFAAFKDFGSVSSKQLLSLMVSFHHKCRDLFRWRITGPCEGVSTQCGGPQGYGPAESRNFPTAAGRIARKHWWSWNFNCREEWENAQPLCKTQKLCCALRAMRKRARREDSQNGTLCLWMQFGSSCIYSLGLRFPTQKNLMMMRGTRPHHKGSHSV